MLTSHRACTEWPTIFTHDRTLTAAILDRLLPHAETVILAGKSVRMQDHIARAIARDEASPEANRRFRRRPAHPCASHMVKPPIFLHLHAVANK
jgi:hypothetical protein